MENLWDCFLLMDVPGGLCPCGCQGSTALGPEHLLRGGAVPVPCLPVAHWHMFACVILELHSRRSIIVETKLHIVLYPHLMPPSFPPSQCLQPAVTCFQARFLPSPYVTLSVLGFSLASCVSSSLCSLLSSEQAHSDGSAPQPTLWELPLLGSISLQFSHVAARWHGALKAILHLRQTRLPPTCPHEDWGVAFTQIDVHTLYLPSCKQVLCQQQRLLF